MKTTKKMIFTILSLIFIFLINTSWAQNGVIMALLNIDTHGLHTTDTSSVTDIVRLEMEKTKTYTILDKYEMRDVVRQNKIDYKNCFSRSCLVEAGKILKVDKMLSGSIEQLGNKIVISLRIIDVKSGTIEKSDIMEFLNLPEIQKMIEIAVKDILGKDNDPQMVSQLVNYDSPINSPRNQLRLNGPRMGGALLIGSDTKILTGSRSNGGFEMYQVTSQFGYQYETQYLSSGTFQALIEYIGTIGGLEAGRVVPTFTFLNGFRSNKSGWEFGLGPTFTFKTVANGYYENDNWHLENDWGNAKGTNPNQIVSQIDSRGNIELSTGLLIAVGKTFKSGYLNIPLNVYNIDQILEEFNKF